MHLSTKKINLLPPILLGILLIPVLSKPSFASTRSSETLTNSPVEHQVTGPEPSSLSFKTKPAEPTLKNQPPKLLASEWQGTPEVAQKNEIGKTLKQHPPIHLHQSAPQPLQHQETAELAQKMIQSGHAALELKQYQTAIKFYQQGVALIHKLAAIEDKAPITAKLNTTDSSDLYTLLQDGDSYLQKAQYDQAEHRYRQAIALIYPLVNLSVQRPDDRQPEILLTKPPKSSASFTQPATNVLKAIPAKLADFNPQHLKQQLQKYELKEIPNHSGIAQQTSDQSIQHSNQDCELQPSPEAQENCHKAALLEAEQTLQRVDPDTAAAAKAWIAQGTAYLGLQRFSEALEAFQQARTIWQLPVNQLLPQQSQGLAEALIGTARSELGLQTEQTFGTTQITEAANQAATLLESTPESPAKITSLQLLSGIFYSLEQFDRALGFAQQAQTLSQHLNLPQEEAKALSQLATIYYRQEQYEQTTATYQTLAELYRQQRDSLSQANVFIAKGELHARLQQFDAAETSFSSALYLFQGLGNHPIEVANTLLGLGAVYLQSEQPEKALAQAEEALKIYQAVQDNDAATKEEQAACQIGIRRAREIRGNAYLALDRYNEGFDSLMEVQDAVQNFSSRNRGWIDGIGDVGDAINGTLGWFFPPARIIGGFLSLPRNIIDLYQDVSGELTDVSANIVQAQFEQAIQDFQAQRDSAKNEGDALAEIRALIGLGNAYRELQQFDDSIQSFTAALELLQTVSDGSSHRSTERAELEAQTHLGRSSSYFLQSDYNAAKIDAQASLSIYQDQLQDQVGAARALYNLSRIALGISDYEAANAQANQAYQQFPVELKYRNERASALLVTASAHLREGHYQSALEAAEQAKTIFIKLGDPQGEANALVILGTAHLNLGNHPTAKSHAERALFLFQQIGDRLGEAAALNLVGNILQMQRQYLQATRSLKLSRQIQEELESSRKVRTIEGDIPHVARWVSRFFAVVSSFVPTGGGWSGYRLRQAISGIGSLIDTTGSLIHVSERVASELGLGITALNLRDQDQAILFFKEAIQLAEASKDASNQANARLGLSNTYLSFEQQDRYDEAQTNAQTALEIYQQIGDQAGRGYALLTLSRINLRLGKLNENPQTQATYYHQAVDQAQEALVIFRSINDQQGEILALSRIGDAFAASANNHQPDLEIVATVFYKQAVLMSEELRQQQVNQLPHEVRQSYVGTLAETYRSLVDLLLRQNRVSEALQVLELLKVQELDDILGGVRSQTSPPGQDSNQAQLWQLYYSKVGQIIPVNLELWQLEKIPVSTRTSEQQNRVLELRKEVGDLRDLAIKVFNTPEAEPIVARLRAVTGGQAPEPEIQFPVNISSNYPNAVLLYPIILPDRLEVVLHTPYGSPIRLQDPVQISPRDLNDAVVQFRQALQNANVEGYQHIAEQFYDWLIKPFRAELERIRQQVGRELTILYVPDGVLRYVPLAALYDGEHWLVEDFQIDNLTASSLTVFGSSREQSGPLRVFIGALTDTHQNYSVPIGDQTYSFAGLKYARPEADNIAGLITNSVQHLDNDFNPDTILTMNDFDIVHLATHAQFIPDNPESSFILFDNGTGNGTAVTLDKVAQWELSHVALIVLSACQTAVDEAGDGSEIQGFAYQVHITAGAKAAIASLWPVSDGATQALMTALYASLQQGASIAEALRQAQIALIRNNYETLDDKSRGIVGIRQRVQNSLPSPDVIRRFSQPYFWAPFILLGDGLNSLQVTPSQ